jgi:hypothetical protein
MYEIAPMLRISSISPARPSLPMIQRVDETFTHCQDVSTTRECGREFRTFDRLAVGFQAKFHAPANALLLSGHCFRN